MYKDDWTAAIARAQALEQELRTAQATQAHDQQRIAQLTAALHTAQAEVARLSAAVRNAVHGPAYGVPPAYVYPSRSGTILVLGILSLVICGLLGPIAWSMGNEELRRIDRGEAPPSGRGNAQAGQICGMIASIFLIIGGVALLFLVAAAGGR